MGWKDTVRDGMTCNLDNLHCLTQLINAAANKVETNGVCGPEATNEKDPHNTPYYLCYTV